LSATRDGGATWYEIPEALPSGDYLHAIGDALGVGWYTTLEPAGANMYVSRGGGATWTKSELLPNREHMTWIDSAQFIDAAHGWLVASRDSARGPGVIFTTRDGGATWTPAPAP
jgi:photosystem II stability/assembly factor-like uncharacterized protein